MTTFNMAMVVGAALGDYQDSDRPDAADVDTGDLTFNEDGVHTLDVLLAGVPFVITIDKATEN